MTFKPDSIVTKFNSKNNQAVVVRYPQWQDLNQLTKFINKLSQEDTFITFSGEKVTKKQEKKYLKKIFESIKSKDQVFLVAQHNNQIIATASIERNKKGKKRTYHVGQFGISVSKDFRGQGIGFQLSKAVINQAKKSLPGLKIVVLNVYQPNKGAIKLYQKIGFKKYGQLPEGILFHQKYVDEVKMYLNT